jgi:hypothetical protein
MNRAPAVPVVLAAALALALTLAGCGADGSRDQAGFSLADSAGVELALNAGADRPLAPDVHEHFRLGGRDTPTEGFYEVGSWNVGVDGAGRIHVMDRDRHVVQVFDHEGRPQATLGGSGSGPGELRIPLFLAVGDDGHVHVADLSKGAIVRWAPDGRILDQDPFPPGYVGGRMAWSEAGLLAVLRGVDGQRLALRPGGDDEVVLSALPQPAGRDLHFASCGLGVSNFPPLFTPSMTWAVQGGTVAVANTGSYAIELYRDGELVRVVRREVAPRPVTTEIAMASLGEGMRVRTQQGELLCDPAEVVSEQGFEPFLPVVSELAIAPDGTLWVRRYALAGEAAPVDVFDPDGRYLGTLPDAGSFPVAFLPEGRILVSEEDAAGVQRLVAQTVVLGDGP